MRTKLHILNLSDESENDLHEKVKMKQIKMKEGKARQGKFICIAHFIHIGNSKCFT